MKKATAVMLAAAFMQALAGCGQGEQKLQGNFQMQYFFSGRVMEADGTYLLIEVNDPGNSALSEGPLSKSQPMLRLQTASRSLRLANTPGC